MSLSPNPCPFCGSTKIYVEPDEEGSGGQWVLPIHVGCKPCGLDMTCHDAEHSVAAVLKWNRRWSAKRAKTERCNLCEDAWRGMIEEKLQLHAKLNNAEANLSATIRDYAKWRSRAEKAEMDLSVLRDALAEIADHPGPRDDEAAHWCADRAKGALLPTERARMTTSDIEAMSRE